MTCIYLDIGVLFRHANGPYLRIVRCARVTNLVASEEIGSMNNLSASSEVAKLKVSIILYLNLILTIILTQIPPDAPIYAVRLTSPLPEGMDAVSVTFPSTSGSSL